MEDLWQICDNATHVSNIERLTYVNLDKPLLDNCQYVYVELWKPRKMASFVPRSINLVEHINLHPLITKFRDEVKKIVSNNKSKTNVFLIRINLNNIDKTRVVFNKFTSNSVNIYYNEWEHEYFYSIHSDPLMDKIEYVDRIIEVLSKDLNYHIEIKNAGPISFDYPNSENLMTEFVLRIGKWLGIKNNDLYLFLTVHLGIITNKIISKLSINPITDPDYLEQWMELTDFDLTPEENFYINSHIPPGNCNLLNRANPEFYAKYINSSRHPGRKFILYPQYL